MDTNKVALTVSVVALFLTIPLSIVGNLLTPRVRNWYGTTNQQRLRNRIEQLQYRLFQTHREWTFSPAEWEIYRFTSVTVLSIIACVTFGFCCLSSGGGVIYTEAKSIADPTIARHVRLVSLTVAVVFFIPYVTAFLIFQRSFVHYRKERDLHTVAGREKLREEIERLQSLVEPVGGGSR